MPWSVTWHSFFHKTFNPRFYISTFSYPSHPNAHWRLHLVSTANRLRLPSIFHQNETVSVKRLPKACFPFSMILPWVLAMFRQAESTLDTHLCIVATLTLSSLTTFLSKFFSRHFYKDSSPLFELYLMAIRLVVALPLSISSNLHVHKHFPNYSRNQVNRFLLKYQMHNRLIK